MLDHRTRLDLRDANRLARHVTLLMEIVMKTLKDLTDKIAELGKDESDYQAREQAIVDALTKQVADLQAQLAANQPPDTQAQIDALQAIIDAIPSAVPPTTTVTEG